ncbi:MAG: glycosyltransferase family 4 protein, partial [Anaerolineales bacterium]|nr:glycosyltransferase family 4 protein [Anaerolineales bacterium]
MRIGIDARIAYYARGGIRSYTLCLLQALAHLDAVGDYVVLVSRKDDVPLVPGPNFRPVTCWTPCHHDLERWALGAEAARLKLDLLHSPDFIPPAW